MTVTVPTLSDAEIKRQLTGSAYRVRCMRNRDLRLQVTTDRTAASWYRRSGRSWRKFGTWPELNSAAAVRVLLQLREQEAVGQQAAADYFGTVGELLEWYLSRNNKDRSLSKQRRQSVRSIVTRQLLPRIGGMAISDVSKDSLDSALMWPMQAEQALSYVRQCLRVLQQAFGRAHSLGSLGSNPLAGVKFSDFTKSQVRPKPAQLSMLALEGLMAAFVERFDQSPVGTMLAIMQLAHGTRVGETRQARWSHVSLTSKAWVIPAENTKTKTEHTLPLTDRMCELLAIYKQRMGARVTAAGPLFVQPGTQKAITAAGAQLLIRQLSGGRWTSHDLRKLARTGWVELGVDYLIGEMLLNHSMGFSAETYVNTSAAELKLDALTRWHGLMDESGLSGLACGTEEKQGNQSGTVPQKQINQ